MILINCALFFLGETTRTIKNSEKGGRFKFQFFNNVNTYIMAKRNVSLKTPKVDLKAKKQEKIERKLEEKKMRKRKSRV